MNQEPPQPGFSEDDLLPVSALADLVFCERRAVLHHVEGIWNDNVFTVEGTFLHRKVDAEDRLESRGDLRIARSLRLRSLRLGLSGIADVVEFHRLPEAGAASASESGNLTVCVPLPGARGLWQPFPVEYKRGRLRREEGYEVQLCAQALCLEEMLGVAVPVGAVFYGQPRRRLEVAFTAGLRAQTESAAARMHELTRSGKTPLARYEKKCDSCSLIGLCLPKTLGKAHTVGNYLLGAFEPVGMEDKGQ
ncbi:MAG: CRISPR-associated protein Cas4 [bacterium]|nr:CRISPR-associated protein Cas4 [bacterium]